MNDFIPEGFVPLADWDHRNRANNDGHSAEWKTLGDAAKAGELPAFKLSNGRWFVHREKAVALLVESAAPALKAATHGSNTGGIDKRHAKSLCESLASINTTLDEIYRVLERLTTAVESIATQPKDTEQMVRNEIMAAVGSNGFHN